MQYNYITKKTEKQVLFCCQGRFIDLSDYSKIDAFILEVHVDALILLWVHYSSDLLKEVEMSSLMMLVVSGCY